GGGEEVRPLDDHGADEQAAVRGALDRQPLRPRVALPDEPLGGGDEVVEDVLLALQHAGAVPVLAVLAAAAQVRQGIDAARFEPGEKEGAEERRHGDPEAAVAVEQGGVAAVELQALAVDEEHADAGAVLGGVPDLLD